MSFAFHILILRMPSDTQLYQYTVIPRAYSWGGQGDESNRQMPQLLRPAFTGTMM